MKFETHVIPHNQQPYNTVGNWFFSDDLKTCYIHISDLGDDDYHHALALHEQTEIMLLLKRFPADEIQKLVDEFDEKFERRRKDDFESEPGDDPKAPYHIEHGFATAVERLYLAAAGKNWKRYEDKMVAVMKRYNKKR